MGIEEATAIIKMLADKFGWGVAIALAFAVSSGAGVAWVGKKFLDVLKGWVDSRETERRDWLGQIQETHRLAMESGNNCVKIQEGMLGRLSNIEKNGDQTYTKLEEVHKDILRGTA